VDEPDPERGQRTSDLMAVLVPVAVPNEQADGEEDDQRRDGRLGAALDEVGEIRVEEQDRDAEDDERERVPEAPPGAERRGAAAGVLAAGGHQRRDRGEVVGVGCVPEAEQRRDEEDDQDRAPVGERGDVVVESEHG
jgi:hypothetical protein